MSGVLPIESERFDLGMEPAPAGFEHAALGALEAGEVKLGELLEEPLGLVEVLFQLGGGGAQRRGIGGGRASAGGIGQERLPGGGVGSHAVGGQERLSGAGGQRVALDGLSETGLLGLREGCEVHRDGEGEPPGVEARAQLGGEPAGERQSPLGPLHLAPQELGDGHWGEVVLLDQAQDDAGLVHGAEGLSRGVGLEELGFLEDARGLFEDHGHLGSPVPLPLGQAFKAVEDLVGLLVDPRDAQRQRGEGGGGRRPRSAQRLERGPEAVDRDGQDERRHGRSSSLVSW
jgi:hypothetical protein